MAKLPKKKPKIPDSMSIKIGRATDQVRRTTSKYGVDFSFII